MSKIKTKVKRMDLLLANKMEFNFCLNITEKLSLIKSIYSKKLLFGLINLKKINKQMTKSNSKCAFQLIASTNAT